MQTLTHTKCLRNESDLEWGVVAYLIGCHRRFGAFLLWIPLNQIDMIDRAVFAVRHVPSIVPKRRATSNFEPFHIPWSPCCSEMMMFVFVFGFDFGFLFWSNFVHESITCTDTYMHGIPVAWFEITLSLTHTRVHIRSTTNTNTPVDPQTDANSLDLRYVSTACLRCQLFSSFSACLCIGIFVLCCVSFRCFDFV